MSEITFFSTHSGAGGACLGAQAAGLEGVGGIEIDDYCVELHRNNFGKGIRHESILDTPIEQLPDFDFFWTSPSCQKFSGSNRDGGETSLDIAIAEKLGEIIKLKKPKYFALENVRQYLYKNKKTKEFTDSFSEIIEVIKSVGYNYSFDVYNAIDFGVPQDRDRLILRASLDSLMPLTQTHSKTGDLFLSPWNGWYKAIEKLLPFCKDTFLTENQLIVLKKYCIDPCSPGGNFILERVGYGDRGPILRKENEPVWTIRARTGCDSKDGSRSPITALLADGSVKALNYLCIAKLQDFPDEYKWGSRAGPNYKAAGNAVPKTFAQRIIESIVGGQK
jgi:DNA (cytosine-5)-methyltransferase 1